MSDISVINFSQKPLETVERCLADLPERVVEGDPHHLTKLHFESPDRKFVSGTWISTPGKWYAFIERDEFCMILSGHVQLISDSGHIQDFKTGDAFQIPNGFKGSWNVIETTTKHFVIRHVVADCPNGF